MQVPAQVRSAKQNLCPYWFVTRVLKACVCVCVCADTLMCQPAWGTATQSVFMTLQLVVACLAGYNTDEGEYNYRAHNKYDYGKPGEFIGCKNCMAAQRTIKGLVVAFASFIEPQCCWASTSRAGNACTLRYSAALGICCSTTQYVVC